MNHKNNQKNNSLEQDKEIHDKKNRSANNDIFISTILKLNKIIALLSNILDLNNVENLPIIIESLQFEEIDKKIFNLYNFLYELINPIFETIYKKGDNK